VEQEKEKQILKWVKKIKQTSDNKAADKLISHYLDEIFGYVFNRIGNREDAKDVTQEIFIGVLQSIEKYDESKSGFRTWLYIIAGRRVVDYYRSKEKKEARVTQMAEVVIKGRDKSSQSKAEMTLDLIEINDFIDNLEKERREIFKMKIFDQLSFSEIASFKEMPESTVKTSFYATQKLIREQFKEGL